MRETCYVGGLQHPVINNVLNRAPECMPEQPHWAAETPSARSAVWCTSTFWMEPTLVERIVIRLPVFMRSKKAASCPKHRSTVA